MQRENGDLHASFWGDGPTWHRIPDLTWDEFVAALTDEPLLLDLVAVTEAKRAKVSNSDP
jgi:hypothetical protein